MARKTTKTIEGKTATKRKSPTVKLKASKKIFVLDTSVILYNHNSINSFDDNDVAIPITVLEELDQFKKGNDTINFEAREFIRIMDRLSINNSLQNWIPLGNGHKGKFKVIMNEKASLDAEWIFGERKSDHRILNAAIALKDEHPNRKVVMVTKDVNLRIKAKALGLPAEDFKTGKIENVDSLHEIKTIITRAGEGTKIIFTGDIYQIDTPYLDAQSNGLSYLIDRIKHHELYAHVRLEKGERSDLANLANELL